LNTTEDLYWRSPLKHPSQTPKEDAFLPRARLVHSLKGALSWTLKSFDKKDK